jgi:hypothetical protein
MRAVVMLDEVFGVERRSDRELTMVMVDSAGQAVIGTIEQSWWIVPGYGTLDQDLVSLLGTIEQLAQQHRDAAIVASGPKTDMHVGRYAAYADTATTLRHILTAHEVIGH